MIKPLCKGPEPTNTGPSEDEISVNGDSALLEGTVLYVSAVHTVYTVVFFCYFTTTLGLMHMSMLAHIAYNAYFFSAREANLLITSLH